MRRIPPLKTTSWPLWAWLGLVAALTTAAGITGVLVAQTRHAALTPVITSTVAVGAAVATTTGVLATYYRTKRRETLEAYFTWSDRLRDERQLLINVVGDQACMSAEQAKSLIEGGEFLDKNGNKVCTDVQKQLRVAVRDLLNSLERLGAGVYLGVYDKKVLMTIGRRTLANSYLRNEQYVLCRRATIKPQADAFLLAESLARMRG
jgi:hypothetical protein